MNPVEGSRSWAGLIEALASRERLLLLTHRNPDGDALGSLLALGEGLTSLGKKVTGYVAGEVPGMYAFMPGLDGLAEVLGEAADYEMVFLLDCHTLERTGVTDFEPSDRTVMAILDHHIVEDPLPDLAVVDPGASSTGELVWKLLLDLEAEITPTMAENLYVAIATDTGFFSFANTTAEAFDVSAALVKAGASPWRVYSRLYLEKPVAKLRLLGLALNGLEFYQGGRIGLMAVTAEMMASTGTTDQDTDGFVEYPRSVGGTEVAALIREIAPRKWKASLRSMGRADVAALARTFGGGGHRQAAGCTLDGDLAEVKKILVDKAALVLSAGEGRAAVGR